MEGSVVGRTTNSAHRRHQHPGASESDKNHRTQIWKSAGARYHSLPARLMGSAHKAQPGSAAVGTPNTPLFADCCGGKCAYECTFRIAFFVFSVNRFGREDGSREFSLPLVYSARSGRRESWTDAFLIVGGGNRVSWAHTPPPPQHPGQLITQLLEHERVVNNR